MRALVYHGPGNKAGEEVAKPTIQQDTDAIVRVDAVTICGTDLHIMKGDVPAVTAGERDEDLLMLADILPTGYVVGLLNGRIQPGDVVAVVGAGPIGLSAIMGDRRPPGGAVKGAEAIARLFP